ncbi:hypothetical protein SUGI_0652780 [Cryptomeria japonica]|nr:hypothetical protein SUGI_0652780 [Cryptomeria japonica]
MTRLTGKENSRYRSISQIYMLRGLADTHFENRRDKLDQDFNIWPQAEHLQTSCGFEQLEGTDIDSQNLQYFSNKGMDANIVKRIQNSYSLLEHNLAKNMNIQEPRMNDFLHNSLDRHRSLDPFDSSSIISTNGEHGEIIRPVSGEDENSNLLSSLERLRALLQFDAHKKHFFRSRYLETPAMSLVLAFSPSPSGLQNDQHKAPGPSPETSSPQLVPSPSLGIVNPTPLSLIASPPKLSESLLPEQSTKNGGNSKTIILAVVITAISTLLLTGLFFYLYKCFFNSRRGFHHLNDNRPLLFSSIHSESLNPNGGESKVYKWATFEDSSGTSNITTILGTGKTDETHLSSFNQRNFRVLSLPSRLRKTTGALDIHPLPPLPKSKQSLELCDRGTFTSNSADTIQNSCSPSSKALQADLSAHSAAKHTSTQSIATLFSASPYSQSTPPPAPSKLPPTLPVSNPSLHPSVNSTTPLPISKSAPSPPPPINKPLPPPPSAYKSPPPPPSVSKPLPPPPSAYKSPPPPPPGAYKAPPPPPPGAYKSPPPPPPGPNNGKSNLPKAPLPPTRNSQLPPPLPGQRPSGSGASLEHLNAVGEDGNPRPKLKPLHWDKVNANPDHSMVWDQIRAGSFQFNEEMIETLFGYSSTNTGTNRMAKQALNPSSQHPQLLDPKKSQNLAIFLKALNVRREEVYDALLEGEGLSPELLETLIKMAPTREEEKKLKEYTGDINNLGPAEIFLKELLAIPFAFERFDKMLYRENFKEEISYIRKSFQTLEAACKELRSSRLFLKLLEAVLKTGNRMNVGTLRGGAQAFKLDTLLKLSDVKGTDRKTTLLHFVVQEIIRAEGIRAARVGQQSGSGATNLVDDKDNLKAGGNMSSDNKEDHYREIGLQALANLSNDLSYIRNAATIDSDALSSSVSKLVTGLNKLRSFLQRDFTSHEAANSMQRGNFNQLMKLFLHQAEEEISQVQSDEKTVFLHVKEITKYFHGNAVKEEAHPFRIFVIVRDFTGMLDQVCKEVGRMQKQNPPASSQKGYMSDFRVIFFNDQKNDWLYPFFGSEMDVTVHQQLFQVNVVLLKSET